MGVDVLTEVVIDRPVVVVAEYVTDPSHAPEWYANIESVRWRGELPVVVGAQMEFVARFLGRRLVYTYEVTELNAHHRLVMRTAQGPFPMETTYEWAPIVGAATRMTLRNRGEPSGLAGMAAPLVSAAVRRANAKDLATLKTLLESR
ncbi:SRPBCC family protein [Kribbella sp. NPDC026596]|uniref:SRPBCC family protein n=1 Tax=Kribbella sp. NPDC026596 TaxID=3155122 RepID=UPI0033D0A713